MMSSGSWPASAGLCETSKTRRRRMPLTSPVMAPRSRLYSSCRTRRLAREPKSGGKASAMRLRPSSSVCSATKRRRLVGRAVRRLPLALRTRSVRPLCQRSSGSAASSLPETSISSSRVAAAREGRAPRSLFAWALGWPWWCRAVVERSSRSSDARPPRDAGSSPSRPLSASSRATTSPCSSQVTPYQESQQGSVSRDQLSLARHLPPRVEP
mmetsp:Transcript_83572/g.245012  ORF Transcript_83572/g.245012 Transcript_83572/m.245012 type:complete len:212 (-) Transcript_83572:484-1119(-)